MRVTILGAGSWGTALAVLLARNGHEVWLFGRNSEELHSISSLRENLRYLPGFVLPELITPTSDVTAIAESDMWVVAVPSGAVRGVLKLIRGTEPLVVLASKGLELGSADLVSQVATEVVPGARVVALSGPNLAVEIVRGIPTAAIAASSSPEAAEITRAAFSCRTFRVYASDDVVGVELAGALKNVLAIASGMADGLGFGDNSKGALLARGLKEMIMLGQAMGARSETFLGIAGVGDLFATAVSKLSRNYRVGVSIGQGKSLGDALKEIGQVAEGVATAESVMVLSRRYQVPMPIFEAVEAVLRGRATPIQCVTGLMERSTKEEGLWLAGSLRT